MPYRRLPNTDIARINALEVVVEIKHTGFRDIALSQDLLTAAERQLIVLRNSHDLHRQAVKMWQENNQKYREIIKNLTAYIIDFVKAYNAAIERGEINPDSRVYYRMTDASLPVFNSEEDILDWGRRLSDGEQKRILAGGAPVTNPTIANLNVYYDKFTDLNFNQKTKLGYIQHTKTKLAQERENADTLIKELWNSIEATFAHLPEDERLDKCREYCVVYYMRSNEKNSAETSDAVPCEQEYLAPLTADCIDADLHQYYEQDVEKIERIEPSKAAEHVRQVAARKYLNPKEMEIPFDFD